MHIILIPHIGDGRDARDMGLSAFALRPVTPFKSPGAMMESKLFKISTSTWMNVVGGMRQKFEHLKSGAELININSPVKTKFSMIDVLA